MAIRLIAHNTIRMMTTNQIGDLFVNLNGIMSENKFGFNFSLITEHGSRLGPSRCRQGPIPGAAYFQLPLVGSQRGNARDHLPADVGTACSRYR